MVLGPAVAMSLLPGEGKMVALTVFDGALDLE